MSEELYKEFILELYRHPINKKILLPCDTEATGNNPSCGDHCTVYIVWDEQKNRIVDIGFQGVGCAISQAAASLVTEMVKGKSKSDVMTMTIHTINTLFGFEITYSRVKCALLCLTTIQKAISIP